MAAQAQRQEYYYDAKGLDVVLQGFPYTDKNTSRRSLYGKFQEPNGTEHDVTMQIPATCMQKAVIRAAYGRLMQLKTKMQYEGLFHKMTIDEMDVVCEGFQAMEDDVPVLNPYEKGGVREAMRKYMTGGAVTPLTPETPGRKRDGDHFQEDRRQTRYSLREANEDRGESSSHHHEDLGESSNYEYNSDEGRYQADLDRARMESLQELQASLSQLTWDLNEDDEIDNQSEVIVCDNNEMRRGEKETRVSAI
ncbi:hypothetical protein BGX31_004583 [Mortierella sp. GBA43]|nr:hypothetical protein BGX31_004583 [Mortierella sp. GBA43]